LMRQNDFGVITIFLELFEVHLNIHDDDVLEEAGRPLEGQRPG
jgi:hypothetical protein